MVKMVKYCIDCRKTFDDEKYTLCPYCGKELIEKEKNRPPLGKLRHQILVRDGYRCRECGKSNKEASLDVDHIYPWSKGGPTIEENLWTLCSECNQAKKDNEWKDNEIEITKNALSNLEDQVHKAEEDLESATTEEEIFALKAKIKDFKKNKIPEEEAKLTRLRQQEERINAERKAQQEENRRRKNLYNKLYVQIKGELLLEVCNHFSLTEQSDEDNIRLLVCKYDEQEINSTIVSIEQELKEELYDKLDNTLSSDELNLFVNKFSFQGSKHELLNYLIYNYTEDEIDSLKVKLVEKEQKRIEEELRIKEEQRKKAEEERKKEEQRKKAEEERKKEEERLAREAKEKLKNQLINTLTPEELSLFSNEFKLPSQNLEIINYLIDNYSEQEIESIRVKLVKEKEKRLYMEARAELKNNLLNTLTDEQIFLFAKEYNLHSENKETIIEYFVDNYSKEGIEFLSRESVKDKLIKELILSIDIKQFIFLCKHFSLEQTTKYELINHLKGCSLKDIRKAIALMNKHKSNSFNGKSKSNSKSNPPQYLYYCPVCGRYINDKNPHACPSCGNICLETKFIY